LGKVDKPIQHLLSVMGKYNFEQPENWKFSGDGGDH